MVRIKVRFTFYIYYVSTIKPTVFSLVRYCHITGGSQIRFQI